ncbi:MAG: ATP-binding protein [Rhodoluna sp.]|nr:ATP-binding protein [Rhodoluna sp.]
MNFWWLVFAFALGAGALARPLHLARKALKPAPDESTTIADGAAEILEALAEAGVVLGNQNKVLKATTAALAMGLISGRSVVNLKLLELVSLARTTGAVEQIELEFTSGVVGAKNLFIRARAVDLGSKAVLLIVEDRTESQRLDETRRDFMANISHELKTPVGAIGLLAETINSNSDNAEMVHKFSKSILKESKRLTALVQDVIQLSRIQASEVVQSAELLDVDEVLREAIERNAFKAERRNIALNFASEKGLKIIGDEEMLAVAFKNIIENAIDYSPEGSKVAVTAEKDGSHVTVKVVDNGVGIAKEDLKRIFERFYRTDPARSRQTGGTGLGLSIVKHVVSSHLGEIRVASKVGVGSTFTLLLPSADKKLVAKKKVTNG